MEYLSHTIVDPYEEEFNLPQLSNLDASGANLKNHILDTPNHQTRTIEIVHLRY